MSNAKSAIPQRQIILLGVLGAILVLVVGYQVLPMLAGGSPAPPPSTPAVARAATPARPAAPGGRQTPQDAARSAAASGEVEPVHLERLAGGTSDPIDGRRNPFSLAPPPPPPSAAKPEGGMTAGGPVTLPPAPVGPPPPPPLAPLAPIAMKFIGTVSGPAKVGRLAALSDGKGVYYGREGDVIEGRYRIVKIGEESIQMEYADGRGRQTIRLSGK